MSIARLLPPHVREGLPPHHTASARILLRLLFILLVDQFPLDAHEQRKDPWEIKLFRGTLLNARVAKEWL